MVKFAQLTSCRRRFMLEYLGEQRTEESCGGCDVCLEPRQEFDATEIAQKVLSAVVRTGERFGANHVIQVLTGSREKRVLEMGHERLSVHGIARDYGRPQLREIIGLLQEQGLLVRSEGEYPTLAVTPEGREFLRGRQPLSLPRPIGADGAGAPGRATSTAAAPEPDATLFEELRALRRRLAVAQNVPPFVVFGDVSLRHMAAAFPRSMEALSRIPGVGEVKLEQYGPHFLEVIRAYAEANGLADQSDAAPLPQLVPAREPEPGNESGGSGASAPPTTPHGSFCPGSYPSPRWPGNAAWRRPQSLATWSSWPLGATSWTWPTSCRRRTGSAR